MAIPKNESFCVLPFTHMNTTTGGLYRFCCIVDQPNKDAQGRPLTLYNHSLNEAWNSEEMANIRLKMISGEKVEACKKCYYEEKHGARSLRKDYNDQWIQENSKLISERVEEASQQNGVLKSEPVFVELKFSNLCNIKCRMCSPFDSSQVQKEYEIIASEDPVFDKMWSHRNKVLFNPSMKLSELPVWHQDTSKIQQFIDLVPRLEKMHFAGGEPTLHEPFYQMIEKAIQSGSAKNLELSFNTNLTQVRSELIEKLSEFKRVIIHASIDGFGQTQEYIRYPTKWPQIVENLQKLCALGSNTKVIVSPTIQIYNLFEIIELFKFIDQLNHQLNNAQKKYISVTPGILDNPSYLNFRILPLELRKEAAKNWKDYASTVSNQWWKDRVLTIASVIADESFASDPNLISQFLHFTRALDKKRSQKFSDLYPKLFQSIERHDVFYVR